MKMSFPFERGRYLGWFSRTTVLVALWSFSLARGDTPKWYTSSFDYVLGTSLELKLEARSAADAAVAENAALAEIDRLAAILSGYDASSEFSRWQATRHEPVRISPELFEVLALFNQWRERTGGVVDAAAETAGRVWQRAAQRNQTPSTTELLQAVSQMSQVHWSLNVADQTATHLSDAPLRLNSFAKSYIIDRACAAALQTGKVSSAVVNIGGDLVVRGNSADVVDVVDPDASAENDEPIAQVNIRDRAMATSGDYRRGVTIAGKWFSHLIDPRTAQPANAVRSATVVSHSATEAGALATALCVMSPEEGVAFARTFADADYLLVLANGSRVVSAGWTRFVAPHPRTANVVAAVGPIPIAGEDPSVGAERATELVVNLEIASIDGRRVKRPYVAVWVENQDHFPVRTVGLWFKGERWLPELRAWSRAERLRSAKEPDRNPRSISSATRGPGRYSLRWDGRDDAGKLLPAGRYTIMIEAAREHGTHQVASAEIDTAGPAKRIELRGNPELSAISLELRPAAGAR